MRRYYKYKFLKYTVLIGALIAAVYMVIDSQVSEEELAAAVPENVTYLDQNWTNKDRAYFYFADQGSRLFPYDYFLNLEQADSNTLFRGEENMRRLGFLPAPESKYNPDGLPVGFARNHNHIGLTCAACHTQQISYKDETVHIDGGQGFLHLDQFLAELTDAIKATVDDPEKFNRFQLRVFGERASLEQIRMLHEYMNLEYDKLVVHLIRNGSDVPAGHARLDAFGAILNQALLATGVENNSNPSTAPTSIPYIWDTPQHDYVEWNGSQSNTGAGALLRNIGEVIGVFGDVKTETTNWMGLIDGGYASSIEAAELRSLEEKVGQLHSPTWPDGFPKIDESLAKQGRGLYEQHCVQCHLDIDRADPKRLIQARMSTLDEIQTDPMMAENAIGFTGKSGKFEGRAKYYFAGDPLPAEAPAIDIANNLMLGVLKNNPLQAYLAKKGSLTVGHPDVVYPPKYVNGHVVTKGTEVARENLLAYKARPLNGVWTSAPFLHNGSVPNLYQLLLPANERLKQFSLGSHEFDPVSVGYMQDSYDSTFLFDTTLPGNSNAGHEYGTGKYGPALTDEERWALIEYIKTL